MGPFLFALCALTGLLFINAITQRLGDLIGKGLPPSVILEFLFLSLPHTVALTLPMAVLVAVLYTFSALSAGSELTAMSAGGIKPVRVLVPMLGSGLILALGMLYFNDQLLPEANHRLAGLLLDLSQKSPTFQLREQVLNEIDAENGGKFFLQAARIDPSTNEMDDIVIHDRSQSAQGRTIYSRHGIMAFNESRTDLYLTLHDGFVLQSSDAQPEEFQRVQFERMVIPLRGVADELQRQLGREIRSDREMTIAMLAGEARSRDVELAKVQEESYRRSLWAVERALGLTGAPPDSLAASTEELAAAFTTPAPRSDGSLQPDPVIRNVAMNLRTQAARAQVFSMARSRYWVEYHKKYSIAFACIVFVLIGAPIGIRFPRGGVGMVIAISLGVFGVYWMGLIGGERMADRGIMGPFLAMWLPNLIFLLLGIAMVRTMGRAGSAQRGGGWDELSFTIRHSLRRLTRRAKEATP